MTRSLPAASAAAMAPATPIMAAPRGRMHHHSGMPAATDRTSAAAWSRIPSPSVR
jgi:hypothetical protein